MAQPPKGATVEDISRAHRLIGRRYWLAAQRATVAGLRGEGADRLADMMGIIRACNAETAVAAAVEKALLQAIDDEAAGVEFTLAELGVPPRVAAVKEEV